jgi:hypothetical protein
MKGIGNGILRRLLSWVKKCVVVVWWLAHSDWLIFISAYTIAEISKHQPLQGPTNVVSNHGAATICHSNLNHFLPLFLYIIGLFQARLNPTLSFKGQIG